MDPKAGNLTLTIDALARAIYVRFSNEKVKKTIEPAPEVFVDLDSRGCVVGIEMINPGRSEELSRDFNPPG
jgi:uncharacterized protein YuzE